MAIVARMGFLFLLPLAAWAGTSADYSLDPTAIDSGGATASSTLYTINASTAPGSAGASANYSLRSGYAGQLLDLANIAIEEPLSPMTLNERETLQLTVSATYDDATKAILSANEVTWSASSGPIAGIDSSGLATAGSVYQDTSALVQVVSGIFSDGLSLTVINTGLDDFAPYAADGLPDLWQVQYLGENRLQGGPSEDVDGDGLSNLQEYAFGMNPSLGLMGTVKWSGSTLLSAGVPLVSGGGSGGTFLAVFARRLDYLAARLTYIVEFSGDLLTWEASTAIPSVLASNAEMQIVSVPYPLFVYGKKAAFFRVNLQSN
jgi:hypothetical protein